MAVGGGGRGGERFQNPVVRSVSESATDNYRVKFINTGLARLMHSLVVFCFYV